MTHEELITAIDDACDRQDAEAALDVVLANLPSRDEIAAVIADVMDANSEVPAADPWSLLLADAVLDLLRERLT